MPTCVDCGKETENKHYKTRRCNLHARVSKKEKMNSWRNRNQEAIKTNCREYRIANAEKIREKMRAYRKNKQAMIRERDNQRTKELSDSYVKKTIGIPGKASPEIIEIKRLQLKLRRLCREKC